jgi:hypothetical protein
MGGLKKREARKRQLERSVVDSSTCLKQPVVLRRGPIVSLTNVDLVRMFHFRGVIQNGSVANTTGKG